MGQFHDAAVAKRKQDSVLLPRELLLEAVELIREQYRALQWRQFLQVDSSLPSWATSFSVRKIKGFAPTPALMNEVSPTDIPGPSLDSSEVIYNVFEFILGATWTKRELIKFAKTGIPVQTEKAAANMRSFEEFFEDLAATGDTYGLMTKGLLNQTVGAADVIPTSSQSQATLVAELPKAAGVGNLGWFDLSSLQPTATALEMAKDMVKVCEFLEKATQRINRATDIILPEVCWDITQRTVTGVDQTRNALDIFRGMKPGVNVRPWKKSENAGDSSKHRITAFDGSDPLGPRMITPEEPTMSAPYEHLLHWEVVQTMTTGGVVVKKPQTIAYMDLTNQA